MPMRRETPGRRASGPRSKKRPKEAPANPPRYRLPSGPRGDAPQTREQDTKRAEQFKKTRVYKRDVKAARDAREEREYVQRMREKAPREAATQRRILKRGGTPDVQATAQISETEKRLRAKYDAKTGNYTRKRVRRFLPDTTEVVDERTGKATRDVEKAARQGEVKHAEAGTTAAALKILDQTLRPTRAIAGAAEKVVEGKASEAPKAAKRGLINNKGPLFGDVLRKAGAPKGVAAVGGFALDVATDPTTYVTAGAGTVAKKAGEKAARETAKRAARAGMSKEVGNRLAQTARRQAEKKAAAKKGGETAGAVVRLAGKELPGVRRATAAASRPIRRATPESVKRAGRDTVRQVSPRTAPEGVSKQEHRTVKAAERRARSSRAREIREGQERARLYARSLKKEDYDRVINAIETRKIGKLETPELREAAVALRSEFRHSLRKGRRSGMFGGAVGKPRATRVVAPKGVTKSGALTASVTRPPRAAGAPKEYIPRQLEEIIEQGATKAERGGGRVLRPTSSKRREASREQTIRAYNEANPEERFSTNVPLVYANYRVEQGSGAAQNQLNRDLAERAGRRIKPGQGATALRENEKVYHLLGGKLRPLDESQAARVLDGKSVIVDKVDVTKNGRIVALNENLVDRAGRLSADERTAPGRLFDTAQRGWKRVATATPGFHIRNAFGDVQMAYLAQKGRRLPANTAAAARGIKRLTQREADLRKGVTPSPRGRAGTVKIAGQKVSLDEFVDDAIREGVVRSAQVGRELDEFRFGSGQLGESGVKKLKRSSQAGRVRQTAAAPFRSLNRGFQNREDLMRLATYKHGLDEGLSKEEAADLAMSFHIDYTDVTDFERKVARRVAPFYTFSARALPMHVKALVQKPGKLANLEKARVEVANAFGLSEDWEGDVSEWKQRAVPFGVRIGDEDVALDVQLPVSLLNELPTSLDPKDYLIELGRFGGGLLTPAIKIPIEAMTGQSLTFRKPIAPPYRHYVAAPDWVKALPPQVKKELDIVPDYIDPQSGKKVAGWSPWSNYWFSQLPGLAYQFQQLTKEGSLQSGRHDYQKIMGVLGVKADPIDPKNKRITELYDKSFKVQDKLNAFRDRGIGGGKGSKNPEVRRLTQELARIDYEIYRQSVARGDRAPLRETAIPNKKLLKPRVKQRSGAVKGEPSRRGGGALSGGSGGSGSGGGALR